jgi:hypothetical protein
MAAVDALIMSEARLSYRIDCFSIPEAAREEFEAAMRRNVAFLETLPGYRGHFVLEKTGGPTEFNIVTIAAWTSQEARESASARVGDYYGQIGFNAAAVLARWGARAELGVFDERRAS